LSKHFVTREKCPACESGRSRLLYRASYTDSPIRDYLVAFYSTTGSGVDFEYFDGARYTLLECQDCGVIFQEEAPDPALTQKLYNEWLDPETVRAIESRERNARHYLWCASEIARVIQYLKRLPSEIRFLDFGMGWGSWCLMAKGFGCDVYGMDLSHAATEYAKSVGVKVIDCAMAEERQFDFINAEQVFEHIVDPRDALARFHDALAPGGVIRISVPNGRNIKRKLERPDWSAPENLPDSLNDVAPLQHLNSYNFDALVRMGVSIGLREVEIPGDLLAPQDMRGKLKALVRPLFRAMFPRLHNARRRRVNNVFFTKT
jgi:SAM-dependent methyltransferase